MSYLISLNEAKTYMQVSGTASDALITLYIDLIEAEISTYLDRNLAIGTYTEPLKYLQSRFDKTGHTNLDVSQDPPNLFLKNYPVLQLTLTAASEIPTTSYHVNVNNGVISSNSQLTEPTASYVAGYTTASAPTALKNVTLMGVISLFNNNKQASQGSGNVKSKSIKDFSVSYGNEQTGYVISQAGKLTKAYIAANTHILDRFKRINL